MFSGIVQHELYHAGQIALLKKAPSGLNPFGLNRHSSAETDLGTDNFINVAVIGVGAFGRNHARIYHQLAQQGESVRLVGVVDPDVAAADAVAREFGCRGFRLNRAARQLRTAKSRPPPWLFPQSTTLRLARALMEAGVDVLVEKPLASSLAEADELIRSGAKPGPDRPGRTPGTIQSGGSRHRAAHHSAHVF